MIYDYFLCKFISCKINYIDYVYALCAMPRHATSYIIRAEPRIWSPATLIGGRAKGGRLLSEKSICASGQASSVSFSSIIQAPFDIFTIPLQTVQGRPKLLSTASFLQATYRTTVVSWGALHHLHPNLSACRWSSSFLESGDRLKTPRSPVGSALLQDVGPPKDEQQAHADRYHHLHHSPPCQPQIHIHQPQGSVGREQSGWKRDEVAAIAAIERAASISTPTPTTTPTGTTAPNDSR